MYAYRFSLKGVFCNRFRNQYEGLVPLQLFNQLPASLQNYKIEWTLITEPAFYLILLKGPEILELSSIVLSAI